MFDDFVDADYFSEDYFDKSENCDIINKYRDVQENTEDYYD